MKVASIILAAGQGTRMRSSLPKVLHPILGRPMAWYAVDAARQAAQSQPVLVVGHGADAVRQAFGDAVDFALLETQGFATLALPDAPFAEGGFATPSGKCEFFSARLAAQGLDDVPIGLAVRVRRAVARIVGHHLGQRVRHLDSGRRKVEVAYRWDRQGRLGEAGDLRSAPGALLVGEGLVLPSPTPPRAAPGSRAAHRRRPVATATAKPSPAT